MRQLCVLHIEVEDDGVALADVSIILPSSACFGKKKACREITGSQFGRIVLEDD